MRRLACALHQRAGVKDDARPAHPADRLRSLTDIVHRRILLGGIGITKVGKIRRMNGQRDMMIRRGPADLFRRLLLEKHAASAGIFIGAQPHLFQIFRSLYGGFIAFFVKILAVSRGAEAHRQTIFHSFLIPFSSLRLILVPLNSALVSMGCNSTVCIPARLPASTSVRI